MRGDNNTVKKHILLKYLDEYFEVNITLDSKYTIGDNINKICTLSEYQEIVQNNLIFWEKNFKNETISYFSFWEEKQKKLNQIYGMMQQIKKEEFISKLNEICDFLSVGRFNDSGIENKIKKQINIKIESLLIGCCQFERCIHFIKLIYDNDDKSLRTEQILHNYIYLIKNPYMIGSYFSSNYKEQSFPAYVLLSENIKSENKNWTLISKNIEEDLAHEKENLEKSFQEKYSDAIQEIHDIEKEIREFSEKYHEEKNKRLKELEEQNQKLVNNLSVLETTYKEKLKLEAPEQLWIEKAKQQKKSVVIWLLITICTAILLIYSLGWLIPTIYESNLKENIILNKSFFLIAIITFFVYIIRIEVKVLLSSRHLQLVYEEKAALTRFYQALIYAGNHIDENQLLLIYSMLFKDTDTGLVKSSDGTDIESIVSTIIRK